MDWFPKLPFGEGPRYLQIVSALENDIATGKVAAGQRLPTHRDMATRLNLSVGTVSKAYAAAERRGLISGEIGRGTFVRPPTPELGVSETNGMRRRINLALNAPPSTGEADLIASVMGQIMADGSRLPQLMGYLPHQGREDHRTVIADWLSRHALPVTANEVFVTHGAQHAISVAMRLVARPGAAVVAENLTYSGMMALALMEGYKLRGVTMDRHGLIPARLDDAFRETNAKVLYCTPTLQSATGAVTPVERRREIAEIVERHDAYVVEDDAYAFLCPESIPTLSSFLPQRSFYVVSFAKCLSPGLRIGAMVTPRAFRDRTVNAIRSTGWMANAIMAEAVVKMIRSGQLEEQIARKRTEAEARVAIAHDILGDVLHLFSDIAAFHVWMQLPAGRTATSLLSQASQAGITLVAPSLLQPFDPMSNGMRLCLGGANDLNDLRYALTTLQTILNDAEAMSLV